MPMDDDAAISREIEPHYSHILTTVASTPWAILPAKLQVIVELLALRASGARLTADEVRERLGAAVPSPAARPSGSVAVLPLHGTLIPRADLMSEMSGATSLERWTAKFSALVADPNVSAIVLDIDSPGGSVYMVEECANAVMAARGQKQIVAVANSLAASAAYWIAAAADELVVTPSGEVGSIGVFGAHQDLSAALEREGVKVSLISAGKFKTEGNPFEPLGADARTAMQARVDDYYGAFVRGVARGRGASAETVRSGFGQGRVVGAKQAVQMGMADQVATLDQTISRVARGKRLDTRRAMSFGSEDQIIQVLTPGTATTTVAWPSTTDGTATGWAPTTTFTSGALQELEPSAHEDIPDSESEDAPVEPNSGPSLDLRRRRLRRRALA